MPPVLVALTEGPNIPLDKPILLVGRHQECDVQIPSRKISRRHCCIAQVHDYVVIKDLFSTNGVRINGTRVKEGCLRAGDELTIGNYRYKVQVNLTSGESPPPLEAPPEHAAQGSHLESFDMPVALADDGMNGPVPQSLPLVLPAGRPNGAQNKNIGLPPVNGEFRAGPPPK